MRRKWAAIAIAMLLVAQVSGAPLPVPGAGKPPPASAQAATTNTIKLRVTSARTEPKAGVQKGDPITDYRFLINVDNTGDPFDETACNPFLDEAMTQRNPNYPDGCDLPSIRTVPAWSPIYTQGGASDLNETTTMTLTPGKYLISVEAEGYKMDGEHFTIPMPDPDGDGVGLVEVQMHPLPLPPATMVIKVFEDVSMTNGQFDGPVEDGLAGFRASLNDIAGEITTDLFGNPLCTQYEKDAAGNVVLNPDGTPQVKSLGNGCYSDSEGIITIPNIGPLRYDVLVFPPAGQQWIQTTTLEGSQGWDTWLQEAGTGLDNEFVVAGEPFPWTIFGFVKPKTPDLGGTGSIKGVIMASATFFPSEGGLPYQGRIFGGLAGTKTFRPINRPWLALNDLQQGDTAVWVGQGNPDGSFNIPNVPPGNYFLTYWDEKQHFILDFVQVTVEAGKTTDVGVRTISGWFTEISGTVFHDYNENGKRDAGEPGIPNYTVVLKDRDNTQIDRMSVAALTDGNGFYELEKGYPMGSWMVLEAYSDLHRTTGVTYQTLNMPEEVTLKDAVVDLGILPILGQPVRVDWGVKPYGPDENGGIGGTVYYDTVRAEDNARYAGAEPWQPGIPGLTVNLYAAQVDAFGVPMKAPDGSLAKGQLLATTVTETYERPKGCQPRDVDGNPMDFPAVPPAGSNKDCLEAPLMGTQVGNGQNPLDGNWGFSEIMFNPDGSLIPEGSRPPLPPGNYLVEVVIPNDKSGKPMFQVTREEDLNVFDGDEFEPAIPPPPCAGPLHIVDIKGVGQDNYPARTLDDGTVVPASTPVDNPAFAAAYPSRYEGQVMPLCNVKHVVLQNGRSVAPIFNLFTDVPIPGRWKGYIINDLSLSVNPAELFFGELAGLPKVPIGLYDYSGRLVHTIHSDRNGVYEALLPSDGTTNAPSPSGMLANVYYIYGNDPGPVGRPNPTYNPQFRSIGTSFEVYPGTILPSDLAPVQNGATILSPGSQFAQPSQCKLEPTTPQIYAVSQPYVSGRGQITISGTGFGSSPGKVVVGKATVVVREWSDRRIVAEISGQTGPHQLIVTAANGESTRNGLTIHVIGGGYVPKVYEVGPGKTYDPANYDATGRGPIQHALDDAWAARGPALVVVYPGRPVPMVNPLGAYLENPVIYSPVRLQGVGPGGTYPDADAVAGSIIDGRAVGGDSPYSDWWRKTLIPDIWNNRGGWDRGLVDGDGNPMVYEGAVITVFGERNEFVSGFNAAMIDGFAIQGGDQQGFPNNLEQIGGTPIPGAQPAVVTQGGGIFVDGFAHYLQITNNVIQGNGGSYGGAIRLGTPNVAAPLTDNNNDNIVISRNRIIANGGTNLAGGIGVFAGSDNYEISYNDLCGNTSVEYGGGISHYGYSPGGKIHHNRIYFNSAYDEGGGIMIAGELPADPTKLSPGAGPVDIYNNLIQSNLSNDDGGGLRFLMAGTFTYNVYNNLIVNNVSTHEGGGISLNDATNVRIFNNTIMKNITTATAMTSNGLPAPAGLSSSRNSALLQAKLPSNAPKFSNPVLFNNVFWDNRAGTWTGDGVSGIGLPGDPAAVFHWDLGLADGSGQLNPQYCLLQVPYGNNETNIVGRNPAVVQEYDTTVRVFPWRGNPNFIGATIVAVDLPVTLMGNYRLTSLSPAIDVGASWVSGTAAPRQDYDDQYRPFGSKYDLGADEVVK